MQQESRLKESYKFSVENENRYKIIAAGKNNSINVTG